MDSLLKKDRHQHINQRYLLYTRRFATMAAGLAVLAVLLITTVVVPQVQSTFEVYQDLSKLDKENDELAGKVVLLQGLSQSELVAAGDTVHSVLPSRKPLLELLTSFSKVANETNVQFSDVSLTPGSIATNSATTSLRRGNQDYDELELKMKVTGSLNNINLFLREVEQVAPITTVTSMTLTDRLSRDQEDMGQELFEADMITTTYFFTQPVSASVRSKVPQLSSEQRTVLDEISAYAIPTLNEQTQIRGGGLQDLFGVSGTSLLNEQELEEL